MPSIIAYLKVFDAYTTYQLATPPDVDCPELCTLDGVTYVSLPDGAVLPPQPAQIASSVAVVVPDAALRVAIKSASPHCALIKDQGHQRVIDAGYSPEDQRKLDRLMAAKGAGINTPTAGQLAAITAFATASLAADAWASEQYAALGL